MLLPDALFLSSEELLAQLDELGAQLLAEPARCSLERLVHGIPGKLLPVQVELFLYASVSLHDQQRIDEVLDPTANPLGLQKHELFWASLYHFLSDAGYALRPRFAPGWRHRGPSRADGDRSFFKHFPNAQALYMAAFRTASATCKRTGREVVFKVLHTQKGHPNSNEIDILKFLNQEPRRSHPHNVCVPVHEYIEVPSTPSGFDPQISLAVMPALRTSTMLGECVIEGFALHAIKQSFEGLAFLHSLGIAHRDICYSNIMFGGSAVPFRVYFIDFGIASHFDLKTLPQRVSWEGGHVRLPEVPLRWPGDGEPVDASVRYDPLAGDVYALAKTFHLSLSRSTLWPGELFETLYDLMMTTTPTARPSADQCLELFELHFARVPSPLLLHRLTSLKIAYTLEGWSGVVHNVVDSARAVYRYWGFKYGLIKLPLV